MQNKLLESELYEPSEDTFFLSKYLENEAGDNTLDIGTGSGYLARILLTKFSNVVATDINFYALKSQHLKIPNRVCCDGASAFCLKFDLIVCNMPYLPSNKISDHSIDGGKDGLEVPLKIIKSAISCLKNGGKLLFLTSSLADYQKLIEQTRKLILDVKIVARKKLFFEELLLIQAKNKT